MTVEVFIDGEKVGETVADESGDWSFEVGEDDALTVGAHTVEARTGISTTGPRDVTVIAVDPPVVALTSPTQDTVTTNNTPIYSGTGTPGATVEVSVDGEVVGEALVGEDGTWTVETAQDSPLSDGPHTIEVAASNEGGTAMLADGVSITVDTSAPTFTVTSPTEGGDLSSPLEVTGTGEPGSTVTVELNGTPVGTVTVGEDGTWSLEIPGALPEGESTISVTSTDPAGNTSAPITVQGVTPEVVAKRDLFLRGGCSQSPGQTPEPGALALMAALGLAGMARRRRVR